MYRVLSTDRIIVTVDRLHRRVGERFANSGLHKVSAELLEVARESRARTLEMTKPILWLRISVAVLVVLIVLSVIGVLSRVQMPAGQINFFNFVTALDAAVNDVVFIAIAIFFLVSIEIRIKRRRALHALHELRAIVHVIDMHQLVKDPAALHEGGIWRPFLRRMS